MYQEANWTNYCLSVCLSVCLPALLSASLILYFSPFWSKQTYITFRGTIRKTVLVNHLLFTFLHQPRPDTILTGRMKPVIYWFNCSGRLSRIPCEMLRVQRFPCTDMTHATTASLKPSFRAPWRVADAVVGRGNARWTTSKSWHPCPYQNCSQGPPAEKIGRGSLSNRASCLTEGQVGQGTELNWTQLHSC